MKIVKTFIEEVPFNWDNLKCHLAKIDWFDPNDSDDWDWFINDYLPDDLEYSEEDIKETEKYKDEIIELMHKRRKREVIDDLYYYIGTNLENFVKLNNDYKVTEEEIHNYITEWFEENG